MRMAKYHRAIATALVVATTASCSALESGNLTVRPRVGQRAGPTVTSPAIPREPRADSGSVGSAVSAPNGSMRRVCRASGWPRDWAATAYEDASGECPPTVEKDSSAVAAIIVRLSAQPLGSVLDICADQALPRGWQFIPIDDEAVPQRCPGAGPDGASAIRRIRRMR